MTERRRSILSWAAALAIGVACAQPSSPSTRPTTASRSLSEDLTIDVGGYSLWMRCEGEGEPTVVLEAGLGDDSSTFSAQVPKISTITRVCAYDRAGLGLSDLRPGETITAALAARELTRLLEGAGIQGPIVLVGHSFGGEIIRAFAAEHPAMVAGMVLLDSSSELQAHGTFARWFASLGEVPMEGPYVLTSPPSDGRFTGDERLGSIPLAVVSHDPTSGQFPPQVEVEWSRFQSALATLSTDSVHVIADGAKHYVHADAPDLVNAAIGSVVDAVRTGEPLGSCKDTFPALGGTCVRGAASAPA